MHLTTLPHGAQTMSSLEIAERTGKLHADVMRDIRVQMTALNGERGASRFAGIYRDKANREKPCFRLPKRECLIFVSGYSVELRAAIIDRWQELEAQQAPRIPTHVEALRLAADAIERADREAEQKVIAQERVKVLEPVAAVGEAITPQTRKYADMPATRDCSDH